MKVTLIIFLNQFILQLYQTYKKILENVQAGLLIQSLITILQLQSVTFWLEAVTSTSQKNQTI